MTTRPASEPPLGDPHDDARKRERETRLTSTQASTEKAQVNEALQPSSQPAPWRPNPSRNYSWAPFEAGNTVSLVHGANSPRAVQAKAAEVHESLIEYAPYLSNPVFAPQVSRYLEATAREQLLHQHIMDVSEEKGPGAVSSRVWEQVTAATRLAAKLADHLGLSPKGHGELRALAAGAERARAGISTLRAQGRRLRQVQGSFAHGGFDPETEDDED